MGNKKKKAVNVTVNAPQNFVAKHCKTFNHATVETDRKKALNRGIRRPKNANQQRQMFG